MEVVAAKLEQTLSLTSGLVRPLLVEDEADARPVMINEFPNNNAIFVTYNYEAIESSYSEVDLFRVSYSENDQFEPHNPAKAKFIARDKDITPVEKTEDFHVLETIFDPSKRNLENLRFKPTRLIVLRDPNSRRLYGPFDYTVKTQLNEGLFSVDLKPPYNINSLPENSVFTFTDDDFEVVELKDKYNNTQGLVLTATASDLGKAQLDHVDFISDEELVKWGNSLLSDTSSIKLNKPDLRLFRQEVSSLMRDAPYFSDRKERLMKLLDKTQTWNTQRSSLINEYLKSEQGEKQIDNFLEINKDYYLEQAKAKHQKQFENQYGEIEKEIQGKQEKIEALREEEKNLVVNH